MSSGTFYVVIYHYTSHYEPEYLLRNDNWSLEIGKYMEWGRYIFLSGYCIGMTIGKIKKILEDSCEKICKTLPWILSGWHTYTNLLLIF